VTIGNIATLVNAAVLVFILRKIVPYSVLGIWFSAIVLISFFRRFLVYRYRKSSPVYYETDKWKRWFIITIALSGLIWGSAAIFMFPVGSIEHQVFMAFVMGGMVAGAAGAFSALISAFLAYSLPASIPLIIQFFLISDEIHIAMGGMLFLFVALMYFAAKRVNKITVSSLKHKFENIGLIKRLEKAKEKSDNYNEELKLKIVSHKKAEEALKESEKKYRNLIERASDGIVIVQDQLIKLVNLRLVNMVDATREDVIDTHIMDYIHPDEMERSIDMYKRRMAGEDVPGVYDSALKHKDGRRIEVEVSGGIISFNGKPADLVLIRDITERKKAEEERRNLESRLQRAEKMEAIGQLAGGVAHDLNNVLTSLVGYPDLLLMKIPEDSPLRRSIMTIQKSGQRAAAIVQDLLTLARRGVSSTEVVSINDIVSEYFKGIEYEKLRAYHKDVQFETNFEEELSNILGSSVHLSKTVMNLVSNAAEALPDGGKVTVSTKNQTISRQLKGYEKVEKGEYVLLSVSDNGIGIADRNLEKIFEPFYTKKKMGRSGTGLGMAVVWGTVKDHKGYIDIHTREGEGTTFELYFPVTGNKPVKGKSGVSIGEYMGNGQKILIVDDVPEQREIASELLNRLGYSVDAVSSGEEAVEYMKTRSVDLLLLDMLMDPGIDGLETYRRILEFKMDQKAIIVSGYSETDRVRDVLKLGVGGYIKKPYTFEKLGLAVAGELER
jgi:PAS domain S-box-containing protein